MVMVQDRNSGKVVVQERVKSWKGLSFPGGHVDEGESLVDSAVREIKEETGLDVFNLKPCGVIHWSNNRTFDRCLVFLYKTYDYSGELLEATIEGTVYWIDIEQLKKLPSTNGFNEILAMFLADKYSEAFGSWNDDEHCEMIYK